MAQWLSLMKLGVVGFAKFNAAGGLLFVQQAYLGDLAFLYLFMGRAIKEDAGRVAFRFLAFVLDFWEECLCFCMRDLVVM